MFNIFVVVVTLALGQVMLTYWFRMAMFTWLPNWRCLHGCQIGDVYMAAKLPCKQIAKFEGLTGTW